MTNPDRLVDWALGELSDPEACEVSQALESSPETAIEVAEIRDLLEEMRTLTVAPSGNVELALRCAISRRNQLRRRGPKGPSSLAAAAWIAARVAAVAATILTGLLLWQHELRTESSELNEDRAAMVAVGLPGPSIATMLERPVVEEEVLPGDDVLSAGSATLQQRHAELKPVGEVDRFTGLVDASNELAVLRMEFTQRYSRKARRESISRCGGRPDLEDRVQGLAATVAEQVLLSVRDDGRSVAGVALGVRALLASGSTKRIGHRDAVSAGLAFLEQRVAALEGGELASALSALTDYAVVSHGRAASLVAEHGERLARSTLELPRSRPTHDSPTAGERTDRDRPLLLKFSTPIAALADAGHVLRLAPAFGVHPTLAGRARLLAAAHLEERLATGKGERPEVVAALLYGFGDLVERRELDHRLLLWGPTLVAGEDLVALHHMAWSQFPLRAGWADFQRELRGLSTLKTPRDIRGASGLLLSLSMNFAAPGVHEVLELPSE